MNKHEGTDTTKYCRYCGRESGLIKNICESCAYLLTLKETKQCPFCQKIVELTEVENHGDYQFKFYSCGHKFKHVSRSIIEPSIKISDSVSWIKKIDPIGAIKRAKNSRNYNEALSLSCTFFQLYGKKILLLNSQKKGNPISKGKLKGMKLSIIADELYRHNLIDKAIYDRMNEVRNMRNDFQHEDLALEISSSQAEEAEATVTKALDSIEFIKTKYESLSKP